MSNFLAIATVSAALRSLVDRAGQSVLNGVSLTVDTVPPDQIDLVEGSAGISVFLYQVSPNAAHRNDDLPTRRPDSTLACRPRVALDLHYLLTFFGDERQQQPERLLGGVARDLHARPLIDRERITQVMAENDHLADSDLGDQVDLVRLAPVELNLEELSKLWSVFFQTNYRLSVAYQASAVLIEPDDSPQPALPVQRRLLYVDTLERPVIEAAESSAGPAEPIVVADTLVIRGRNLAGELTRVVLGSTEVEPAAANVSSREIRVDLAEPPFTVGALRAGMLALQVVHERLLGDPETAHRGLESNVVPVIVRPSIRLNEGDGTPVIVQGVEPPPDPPPDPPPSPMPILTVTADPVLEADQRVLLLLNRTGQSYSLPALRREAAGNDVVFRIPDVTPGAYLVRLAVDGAESPLAADPAGGFAGPTFEVTA